MNKYMILGKVDNRVIAYPIIRALSMQGKVAVITDDRAFRRLYHGNEDTGEVNGVDIFMSTLGKSQNYNTMLSETGMKYDTVVYVLEELIQEKINGVISCIGVDYSLQGDEYTEKVKKGSVKEDITVQEEVIVDKEPDFSEDTLVARVTISFDAPKKSTDRESVILKDANLRYIYECEEKKRIAIYPDRAFNNRLSILMEKSMKIDRKIAYSLLLKKEHTSEK